MNTNVTRVYFPKAESPSLQYFARYISIRRRAICDPHAMPRVWSGQIILTWYIKPAKIKTMMIINTIYRDGIGLLSSRRIVIRIKKYWTYRQRNDLMVKKIDRGHTLAFYRFPQLSFVQNPFYWVAFRPARVYLWIIIPVGTISWRNDRITSAWSC